MVHKGWRVCRKLKHLQYTRPQQRILCEIVESASNSAILKCHYRHAVDIVPDSFTLYTITIYGTPHTETLRTKATQVQGNEDLLIHHYHILQESSVGIQL